MANEQWKPVVGFEGLYEVSDHGRVRSFRRCGSSGGAVAVRETHRGHLRVDLCKNGKKSVKRVHRLVLEAFSGPCPNKMECRHLNGVPDDNRPENLKWGTHAENRQDMIDHGTSTRGEKNPNAKLTIMDVKLIRIWLALGYKLKEIAGAFGVTGGNIQAIDRGVSWSWLEEVA